VKAKMQRHKKKRRVEESESEDLDLVQVVDKDVEPPEDDVEEVDARTGEKDPTDEPEVSTDHLS